MPCRYDESPGEIQARQHKLDVMARLACDHCKQLEATGLAVPEWAEAWWAEHKVLDAAREAREAKERQRRELAVAAMARLSADELAALGVRVDRIGGE